MSNEPQGLITFTGVEGYLTGSFTLGHGIGPSLCRFQCVPQQSPPPEVGTLTISFGSSRIVFPDCRLLEVDNIVDGTGKQAWALTVADFRWRWKSYLISGQYNLRRNDQQLDLSSKKNSRELAKLLLEKMELPKADCSQVPEDLFPYVDWDYVRADQQLQKLLDSMGCRLAVGQDNSVRVVRLGIGQELPRSGIVDGQASFEVTEWPDQMKFVAGPTMVQIDVPLEYVALEPVGNISPLWFCSYRPMEEGISKEKPFKNVDPGSLAGIYLLEELTEENRKAAQDSAKKSVFKWFQPKMPLQLFGDILKKGKENQKDEVTELWQILPLLTTQIQHFDHGKQQVATPDAMVWGYHDPMNMIPDINPPDPKVDPKSIKKEKTPTIFKEFEIDQENGIIKFDEPIIKRFFNAETGCFENVLSQLYLRVAVQVREVETRSKVHHEVTKDFTPPSRSKKAPKKTVQTIVNNDIQLAKYRDVETGEVKDNIKEVEKQANYYFEGEMRSKLVGQPATVTYAGFLNIFPDGKIFQVSWLMGSDGAKTRVSRLKEDTRDVISYREMQWLQNTNRIVRDIEQKKLEQKRK